MPINFKDIFRWISTGQFKRSSCISGFGFLSQFPGGTSSEEFVAEKHAETDEEEHRSEERGKLRNVHKYEQDLQ